MKKFSSVSGAKVGEKPDNKIDEKAVEVRQIKYKVHQLIEEHLKVVFYQAIDEALQRSSNIEGREEFINAVVDLFSDGDIQSLIKEDKKKED